jgi:hypothetical protein
LMAAQYEKVLATTHGTAAMLHSLLLLFRPLCHYPCSCILSAEKQAAKIDKLI